MADIVVPVFAKPAFYNGDKAKKAVDSQEIADVKSNVQLGVSLAKDHDAFLQEIIQHAKNDGIADYERFISAIASAQKVSDLTPEHRQLAERLLKSEQAFAAKTSSLLKDAKTVHDKNVHYQKAFLQLTEKVEKDLKDNKFQNVADVQKIYETEQKQVEKKIADEKNDLEKRQLKQYEQYLKTEIETLQYINRNFFGANAMSSCKLINGRTKERISGEINTTEQSYKSFVSDFPKLDFKPYHMNLDIEQKKFEKPSERDKLDSKFLLKVLDNRIISSISGFRGGKDLLQVNPQGYQNYFESTILDQRPVKPSNWLTVKAFVEKLDKRNFDARLPIEDMPKANRWAKNIKLFTFAPQNSSISSALIWESFYRGLRTKETTSIAHGFELMQNDTSKDRRSLLQTSTNTLDAWKRDEKPTRKVLVVRGFDNNGALKVHPERHRELLKQSFPDLKDSDFILLKEPLAKSVKPVLAEISALEKLLSAKESKEKISTQLDRTAKLFKDRHPSLGAEYSKLLEKPDLPPEKLQENVKEFKDKLTKFSDNTLEDAVEALKDFSAKNPGTEILVVMNVHGTASPSPLLEYPYTELQGSDDGEVTLAQGEHLTEKDGKHLFNQLTGAKSVYIINSACFGGSWIAKAKTVIERIPLLNGIFTA